MQELMPSLLKLLVATGLGAIVAGAWWWDTRRRQRTPGFAGTLVLLALLISFVTMAVGSNTAVAFTLVGTLAIVRFRTAVRDIRDTAFVIFAVGVGIAASTVAPELAAAGTAFVAFVVCALGWFAGQRSGDSDTLAMQSAWRLQLRCAAPGLAPNVVEACLKAHAKQWQMLMTRSDGDSGLRQVWALDIERSSAAGLVSALQALPGMRRVTLSYGDGSDDEA